VRMCSLNWPRSWKELARKLANQLVSEKRKTDFWHQLSNSSPSIETSSLLDRTELERMTLLTLMHGLRADLDFLVAEGLASPYGMKVLGHMRERIKDL
jgi:hypothetical protein